MPSARDKTQARQREEPDVAPGTDRARSGHDAAARLTVMTFYLVEVELRGLEPLTPCLQNTPALSDTVAHLDRIIRLIRLNRPVSGPVVVSLGGQPGPADRRLMSIQS
jgi:hypothetical protein